MAIDEGTIFYVGDTQYTVMYVGNEVVAFNPLLLSGYASYSFTPDPYSASLLLALPGNQAYADFASLPNAWSDISANIRGTGVNKNVTPQSVGLYQSSSIAYFANYTGSTFTSGAIVVTGSLYSPYTAVNSAETIGSASITIEGWANVPTSTPNRMLFNRYTPTVVASSELRFALTNSGGNGIFNIIFVSGSSELSYNSSTFSVVSGSWNHFALTKESDTIRLYWSGSKVGEITDARISNLNAVATLPTRVFGETVVAADTSTNLHFQDFRYYKGAAKYTGSAYTLPDSMIIQTII
jgi:hypothetical protein